MHGDDALLGQLRETGEVGGVGAYEGVSPAVGEHLGVGDGRQPPVAREGLGGDPERLPAHGVERGVEAFGHQVPQPAGESFAVLHGFAAQPAHVVVVVRPGGPDDPAARVAGELDGERADASGRRVDEDGLALLDLQRAVQHLVGGEAAERQTRRLLEADAQGLAREGAHGCGDVLGEGSAREEVLAHVADDLVPHGELVHGGAGLDHDPGDVPARDDGEDGLQPRLEIAFTGLPVDRVDGGGPHLDQDRVRPDLRVGPLAVLQYVGGAVPAVADRLHPPTISAGRGPRNSGRERLDGRQQRPGAVSGVPEPDDKRRGRLQIRGPAEPAHRQRDAAEVPDQGSDRLQGRRVVAEERDRERAFGEGGRGQPPHRIGQVAEGLDDPCAGGVGDRTGSPRPRTGGEPEAAPTALVQSTTTRQRGASSAPPSAARTPATASYARASSTASPKAADSPSVPALWPVRSARALARAVERPPKSTRWPAAATGRPVPPPCRRSR